MYGRAQSRSTGLFFTLCAAAAALTIVTQQPWAAGPRGVAKSALEPLEAAMASAAAQYDRLTSGFGDVSTLRAENEQLRAADDSMRRQLVQLDAAAKENATLREELNFERSYGRRMVAAEIVGRGPDSFSRTLEIDRGSADGVLPGMVVTTGAGLLGRVGEAGPHVAIVQTLADPQSRVNVVLSQSRLQGTVTGGASALGLSIEHSFGASASDGEWVLTSGVGAGYPRGLVVGQVANLVRDDAATSDQAQVAWVNDPAAISFVLVITDFLPS